MAQLVKCPHCSTKDSKENMVQQGKRYWHEECITEHEIEKENSKTEEQKLKDRDKQERKDLIDYILELFNLDKPTGMILKQIKDLHDEPYFYRYKAMQMTLEYFFEIKNNSTSNARGIGIVPYVYDEASEFYKSLARINKDETEINKQDKKVVTIKITPNTNRRSKKTINMEDI
ncbi:hypothetical protein QOK74_08220 [Staphylococcus saprophyticus]|uniref:hypothetical protein n=1 Tax=Staphylococcus saprophyticus TaxID=29385 RepID=UPI0024C22315|nr:hypothetical protein [Staphylococcus saprophyticus]MDK1672856.1 hypothetical protein [Staphylococcus saprophyticus]